MNEFNNTIGNEPNINLRNIVSWTVNGKSSDDWMIYKTSTSSIGMVGIYSGVAYPREFSNLAELKDYLEQKETDRHLISIRDEWVPYTP